MIGSKLKEIREKTGMNKKEFAHYIGIKYTTYNNYETEAREPASDFLTLISKKFDVSIDYLLGLKEDSSILHSYQLKSFEYEHIKKYRELTPAGQQHVDTVLEWEMEHTEQLKIATEQVKFPTYTEKNILSDEQSNPELSIEERSRQFGPLEMPEGSMPDLLRRINANKSKDA